MADTAVQYLVLILTSTHCLLADSATTTTTTTTSQLGYGEGTVINAEYTKKPYQEEIDAMAACDADSGCKGYWQRYSGEYRLLNRPGSRSWKVGVPDGDLSVKVKAVAPVPAPPSPSPPAPAPPTPAPIQGLAMDFGPPIPLGGPPIAKGYGGKMSNVLDLYPDGFASQPGPVWTSTDEGRTFHKESIVVQRNQTWTSFVTQRDSSGHMWGHDFGAVGQLLHPASANFTNASSDSTFTYRFVGGNLTRTLGPGATFTGMPRPLCPTGAWTTPSMSPYASGHVILPDGTHLQSMIAVWCGPPFRGVCRALITFSSKDGYNYKYLGNISTCLDDLGKSSEGANEHDIALLPNGDVMSVFRTGAGDGKQAYLPFYMTKSSDGGRTWSKPAPMVDTDGHGMGCARPHLLQLGNATLLSGGRMMMGHDYSRSFSVWLSQDAGETWQRADGSYHHNAKASMKKVPLWPAAVNKTGWRFEFTSGYVGLARVGEASAVVLYDLMVASPEPERYGKPSTTLFAQDFLDDEFSLHNPPFSFSMRIDLVSAAPTPAPGPTPAPAPTPPPGPCLPAGCGGCEWSSRYNSCPHGHTVDSSCHNSTLGCEAKCDSSPACIGFLRRNSSGMCFFYERISGFFESPGVDWHPKPPKSTTASVLV